MNDSGRPGNSLTSSASGRQTPAGRGPAVWALVVTNCGVLLVLLFGPNANHPILPLAYGGGAIAAGGLVLIVRSVAARRRNDANPPTKVV